MTAAAYFLGRLLTAAFYDLLDLGGKWARTTGDDL